MNNESGTHVITQSLATVVRGICSRPKELQVFEVLIGSVLTITFRPHGNDIAVLIGRGFRQKNALTMVASAMGRRAGLTVDVDIDDSNRGEKHDQVSVADDPSYGKDKLIPVLAPVIELALGDVAWKVFEERARLKVEIYVPDSEAPTVVAIGDLAFAFGRAKGREIDVKFKPLKHAPEVLR